VDDRIRAIAQALNLQTILWSYDSDDWQFGSNGVTKAQVDANYQKMLNDGRNGKFATVSCSYFSPTNL
jgi:peptidoglycan/xylan/chitin deacetylase (PgdA/CDA1 family)